MTQLLRDLPFFQTPEVFYLNPSSRYVTILHRQIPVRISLGISLPDKREFVPARPSFPAILDTGFNGSLALSRFHVREWAGVNRSILGTDLTRKFKSRPILRGFPTEVYETRFYIRPNRAGTWDEATDDPIVVRGRIFVVDALPKEFPLPLLGMTALDYCNVQLLLDFKRRVVQAAQR